MKMNNDNYYKEKLLALLNGLGYSEKCIEYPPYELEKLGKKITKYKEFTQALKEFVKNVNESNFLD